MASDFKIPYALASGRAVYAGDAERGKDYTCPDCEGAVRRRGGPKRRDHFFHASRAPQCSLAKGGESAYHLMAKLALLHRLQLALDGNCRALWSGFVRCPSCPTDTQTVISLPYFDAAHLEKRADLTLRRPDVVLTHEERAVAYLEVYYSHATDNEKAEELEVPWLEILAIPLIQEERIIISQGSLEELTDYYTCMNIDCWASVRSWHKPPQLPLYFIMQSSINGHLLSISAAKGIEVTYDGPHHLQRIGEVDYSASNRLYGHERQYVFVKEGLLIISIDNITSTYIEIDSRIISTITEERFLLLQEKYAKARVARLMGYTGNEKYSNRTSKSIDMLTRIRRGRFYTHEEHQCFLLSSTRTWPESYLNRLRAVKIAFENKNEEEIARLHDEAGGTLCNT